MFIGPSQFGSWYPAVLNVFYQGHRKVEWTSIAPNRMEMFFRTVTFLLSSFLRTVIARSVDAFCNLFCDPNQSSVQFLVKCVPDENEKSIKFEPPLDGLFSTVASIFEHLTRALERCPRVETQLFSHERSFKNAGSAASVQMIPVDFPLINARDLEDKLQAIRVSITSKLDAPKMHVERFDKFHHLLTDSDDLDVGRFLENAANHQPQSFSLSAMINVCAAVCGVDFNVRKCKNIDIKLPLSPMITRPPFPSP